MDLLRKCIRTWREGGLRALARKARGRLRRGAAAAPDVAAVYEAAQRAKAADYAAWLAGQRRTPAELAAERQAVFPVAPLISIVVPVYNTASVYLQALVESILAQTYARFELLLVDGCSTREETRRCLRSAVARDARVHVLRLERNAGISGNTNEGIVRAAGSYIAFADHDDTLEPDALYEIVRAIAAEAAAGRRADVIYTDEDKMDETGTLFYEPHRKPDYSPEKLQSCNYCSHLTVMSRAVLQEVGLLRAAFDGSQDHDLTLRACDAAQAVCHVPRVLYHWRQFASSMSKQHLARCQAAGRRAVAEHLARVGRPGEVTQDHGYRVAFPVPDVRVATIPVERDTTYAALNRAARQSTADVLLLRDTRLEPLADDWEQELLMYAVQDGIGCVGGLLCEPDGMTICLTDLMLAPDGPRREFGGHRRDVIGQGGRERIARNVTALSAALLMVRRDVFLAAGGFDEGYQQAFGDIDLCLRLLRRGYRHVFTPYASLRFRTAPAELERRLADRSSADWQRFAAHPEHFCDHYSRLPFEEELAAERRTIR